MRQAIVGRKGIGTVVSTLARDQPLSVYCSRSLPHFLVRRAKIALMAGDGHGSGSCNAARGDIAGDELLKEAVCFGGAAGLNDGAVQADIARIRMKR